MASENLSPGQPRALQTIGLGGLAIGILDFCDASIFFPKYFGITIQRVWQGVAAGFLGRDDALAGGWNSAALGMFLHFCFAFLIATSYYLVARYLVTVRQPVIVGLLYGVMVNLVMQHIVIPLSAIGFRATPESVPSLLNSFIGHALLVGLPVALIAAWSARKERPIESN